MEKKIKDLTKNQIDSICKSAYNCYHCPLNIKLENENEEVFVCDVIGHEEQIKKKLNEKIDFKTLLKETKQRKKRLSKD